MTTIPDAARDVAYDAARKAYQEAYDAYADARKAYQEAYDAYADARKAYQAEDQA